MRKYLPPLAKSPMENLWKTYGKALKAFTTGFATVSSAFSYFRLTLWIIFRYAKKRCSNRLWKSYGKALKAFTTTFPQHAS